MGRARGKARVLMGCHEPLAGSDGAVRSIGGVWFGANRGMPAGMSRCSMLCHGWAGGVRGCRGVVTSGAKCGGTGGMRCDDDYARRREWGPWGSGWNGLTVTGCQRLWWGSWPGGVGGMIVKSPKRQGMRVLGR